MPDRPPSSPFDGRSASQRGRVGAVTLEGRVTGRETIAGYSLIRPLGRGGMAEVWLGARTTVGGSTKMAAIKFVAAKHAGHEQYSRLFKREAELTSQLEHQNIVKVYDEGEEDGISFIAMEYVDGATVRQIEPKLLELLEHGIGEETRIKICAYVMQQVLKALAFAHRVRSDKGHPLGVVHRDVSPDNILVSHSGEVKLTDWGVAFAGGMTDESSGQHVRGKPRYMAPEQIAGETRDPRVDIYAAGAVLQQLLDGAVFRGETPANRLHTEVLSGRRPAMRRAIPFHLEAILSKMLASDPGHRYATAQDVLDDLRRWPGFADMSEELGAVCRSLTGILAPRTRPSVSGPEDAADAEPPTRRLRTPRPPRAEPPPSNVAADVAFASTQPREVEPPAPAVTVQEARALAPGSPVVAPLPTTERITPRAQSVPSSASTEPLRAFDVASAPNIVASAALHDAPTHTADATRRARTRRWLRPVALVGGSVIALCGLALMITRSNDADAPTASASNRADASSGSVSSESALGVAAAPASTDLDASTIPEPEHGPSPVAGPVATASADPGGTPSVAPEVAARISSTPVATPTSADPSAPTPSPVPAASEAAADPVRPSIEPAPKRAPAPRPAEPRDPPPGDGPPVIIHFRLAPDSGLTAAHVKLGKAEFEIAPRYDTRVPSGRHSVSWRASPTDPWRKSGSVTLDASIANEWTMRVGKSGPKLEAFR